MIFTDNKPTFAPNGRDGKFSLHTSPVFNSLPLMLQESILQMDMDIESEDELKAVIERLNG